MKPILFNAEMVQAILGGRKTVTRRVVKLKYSNTHLTMRTDKYGTRLIELQKEEPGVTVIKNPDGTTTHRLLAAEDKIPPYQPGDILYVRETWRVQAAHRFEADARVEYKAGGFMSTIQFPGRESQAHSRMEYDAFVEKWADEKWHPSIHMPKEAARLFLRMTDVRVERLQDMTGHDVLAEGVDNGSSNPTMGARWENMQRMAFEGLWNSTIKKADLLLYGWNANPWVWVIEFERISKEAALKGGKK